MSSNTAMEKVAVNIWLNMPSPHQEDLLRSIASRKGADVQVYYSMPLSESRASEGWSVTPRGYKYRTFLRRVDVVNVAKAMFKDRKRVQVFGGIWSTPNIALAVTLARVLKIPYLVLSESPDHPPRPVSRLARHRIKRHLIVAVRDAFGRCVIRGSQGILAISRFAEIWYANHGMDSSHIYPFGYFKTIPVRNDLDRRSSCADLRLLYVGRKSYAKGLDLLLEALEPLWEANDRLRLEVIGKQVDDIQPGKHGMEAKKHGRLVFKESLPFDEVEQVMRQSDVLILPSRGDGWGMVVVEALMNGLPVIVSDQCGASDVICGGRNGFVFTSGDISALRGAIVQFLSRRDSHAAMRQAAWETGTKLDADSAADYFRACIEHAVDRTKPKPLAPWIADSPVHRRA